LVRTWLALCFQPRDVPVRVNGHKS
jgi:hypothetical protein